MIKATFIPTVIPNHNANLRLIEPIKGTDGKVAELFESAIVAWLVETPINEKGELPDRAGPIVTPVSATGDPSGDHAILDKVTGTYSIPWTMDTEDREELIAHFNSPSMKIPPDGRVKPVDEGRVRPKTPTSLKLVPKTPDSA